MLVEEEEDKVRQRVKQEAYKLVEAVKKGKKPSPSMRDLFWFRIWQASTNRDDGSTKDRDYWTDKGWYQASYFYEDNLNRLLDGIVGVLFKLGSRFMMSKYR